MQILQQITVIIHVVFAIASFSMALIALSINKGSKFHPKVGRVFVISYIITLITSFIISIGFDIYEDAGIKYMLFVEGLLAVEVFNRGLLAVRYKAYSRNREILNTIVAVIVLFAGISLFCYGLWEDNNIIIVMGAFVSTVSGIDAGKSMRYNSHNYRWKYDHFYGMIFTAALLIFNGTSFFWIKEIYFKTGNVPLERMLLSVTPMVIVLIIIEIIRMRVVKS